MSGTDHRIDPLTGTGAGPAVILVDPQLGENIGMAARAMLNCGLTDLRLVRPRDGWPNEKASRTSAGADMVLERAQLFERTEDAILDLTLVYAATARTRDMIKVIVSPTKAAAEIRGFKSGASGIIFGGEAMGLNNDDIALADKIITTPLNPGFSSLNLSQAVLLIAHEWFKLDSDFADSNLQMPDTRPATKQELIGLFEHLEGALDDSGFLHIKEKRPIMSRNLRNLFQRAQLTDQEVRTLRGVITSLAYHGNSSKKS